MSRADYDGRRRRLRDKLLEQGADAVLVSKEVNLHYFSGFRGDDTMLLITPVENLIITDNRYTEQATQEAGEFEVIEQTGGLLIKIADIIKARNIKTLAFEENGILYKQYAKLKELLPAIEMKPLTLDNLRQIKDEWELACIRHACQIADNAFTDVLNYIRAGLTEKQVAAHMENFMREQGSERPAFTTIVASGVRGSLPHGVAGDKIINEGELVTIDFGAVYEGYHSDMTRTIGIGNLDSRQQEYYEAVRLAQLIGLDHIKAGVSGRAVDRAVRDYLSTKDLNRYFGHGLGHSVGLEIHEEPRLSPLSDCEALLPNMLVTDEPGIYIAGWGGIRIEDTVLVTESGAEPLTHSSKELILV